MPFHVYQCNGDGQCYTPRTFQYDEKKDRWIERALQPGHSYIVKPCKYRCRLERCANWQICLNEQPSYTMKESGLCRSCNKSFGPLVKYKRDSCEICCQNRLLYQFACKYPHNILTNWCCISRSEVLPQTYHSLCVLCLKDIRLEMMDCFTLCPLDILYLDK